jgi:hypothetical protein
LADEREPQAHTRADALRFMQALTTRLGLGNETVLPGYEDTWYYLWRERRYRLVLGNRRQHFHRWRVCCIVTHHGRHTDLDVDRRYLRPVRRIMRLLQAMLEYGSASVFFIQAVKRH